MVLRLESQHVKLLKANLFLSHRVRSVNTRSQTPKLEIKTNEIVEKHMKN